MTTTFTGPELAQRRNALNMTLKNAERYVAKELEHRGFEHPFGFTLNMAKVESASPDTTHDFDKAQGILYVYHTVLCEAEERARTGNLNSTEQFAKLYPNLTKMESEWAEYRTEALLHLFDWLEEQVPPLRIMRRDEERSAAHWDDNHSPIGELEKRRIIAALTEVDYDGMQAEREALYRELRDNAAERK